MNTPVFTLNADEIPPACLDIWPRVEGYSVHFLTAILPVSVLSGQELKDTSIACISYCVTQWLYAALVVLRSTHQNNKT